MAPAPAPIVPAQFGGVARLRASRAEVVLDTCTHARDVAAQPREIEVVATAIWGGERALLRESIEHVELA